MFGCFVGVRNDMMYFLPSGWIIVSLYDLFQDAESDAKPNSHRCPSLVKIYKTDD